MELMPKDRWPVNKLRIKRMGGGRTVVVGDGNEVAAQFTLH
jgi:hypothetical protein